MRSLVLISVALAAALSLSAQKPDAPEGGAGKDAIPGLPPRVSPAEYQFQGKAGSITIAAELDGHSVPLVESILTTENYVVVEAAFFGPPGAHLLLTNSDFSLRVNGKKMPTPNSGPGTVYKSLKDPSYDPPANSQVGKTRLDSGGGGGGRGQDDGLPPPPPHVPIEVQLAMELRTKKASMPQGDRPLPQAGLLFFEFTGKMRTAELIYNGPAGKATINLMP